MIEKILIAVFTISLPVLVEAQTRVSGNIDFSSTMVTIEKDPAFKWYGFSAEIEHEFKKDKLKLSGFFLGLRKEGKDIYNGTYITTGLFHSFDMRPASIIVSGGVIYGLPGIQFDRTKLIYQNGNVAGYKNISMKRNIHVPTGEDTGDTGIIQPTIGIKVRKYLGRFFIEGRGSGGLAQFTTVDSDFRNSTYKERLVLMPSLGVGLGFSF